MKYRLRSLDVPQAGTMFPSIITGVFLLVLLFGGSVILAASQVHAADGDLDWAWGFGQTLNDEGYDIFVDAAGNVYSTGYFVGTVDFNPGGESAPLTSVGSSDIFISKLAGPDPAGKTPFP